MGFRFETALGVNIDAAQDRNRVPIIPSLLKRILDPALAEDVASTTRFWAPTAAGDINAYATHWVLVNSGDISYGSRQSVLNHIAVKCSGSPITVVCTSYGGVVTLLDGSESWRPSSFRAWEDVLELAPGAGSQYLQKSTEILEGEIDPEIRAYIFAQQVVVRAAIQAHRRTSDDVGR